MDCPITGKQCESTGCTAMGCSIQNWQQNAPIQFMPKRNMVIRYSKKFPYAPYLNEDIGFEMTIGEHENPLEKMEELRQMAKQFHEKNNPQLYQEQIPQEYITGSVHNNGMFAQPTEPQQVKLSPQDEENNLITSIESAQNEKELIQYKLLAAKNIKASGSYKKRAKQLNLE